MWRREGEGRREGGRCGIPGFLSAGPLRSIWETFPKSHLSVFICTNYCAAALNRVLTRVPRRLVFSWQAKSGRLWLAEHIMLLMVESGICQKLQTNPLPSHRDLWRGTGEQLNSRFPHSLNSSVLHERKFSSWVENGCMFPPFVSSAVVIWLWDQGAG